MLRWLCLIAASIYFLVYPNILLVPEDYRQGYLSFQDNVFNKGIVIGREEYEVSSLLNQKKLQRVYILTNGRISQYWVANSAVYEEMEPGNLVVFEAREKVIFLAASLTDPPPIVSMVNY